jgi:hypothetical protein
VKHARNRVEIVVRGMGFPPELTGKNTIVRQVCLFLCTDRFKSVELGQWKSAESNAALKGESQKEKKGNLVKLF